MATERVNRTYEILREGDKAQQSGNYEAARAAFEGAREEFHRADYREGVSEATCRLGFLAMRQEKWEKAPFYRLQGKRKSPGAVDALPLKILVAICNPVTLEQMGSEVEKLVSLTIEQERDIIERAPKRLKDAKLADYDIWSGANGDKPVTLFNLQERLEDGYHVLHLISHGAAVD